MNSAPLPIRAGRRPPLIRQSAGDSRHLTSLPHFPSPTLGPGASHCAGAEPGRWAGGGVGLTPRLCGIPAATAVGENDAQVGLPAAGREEARTAHAQTEHPRQKQKRARAPHVLRAQLLPIRPAVTSARPGQAGARLSSEERCPGRSSPCSWASAATRVSEREPGPAASLRFCPFGSHPSAWHPPTPPPHPRPASVP